MPLLALAAFGQALEPVWNPARTAEQLVKANDETLARARVIQNRLGADIPRRTAKAVIAEYDELIRLAMEDGSSSGLLMEVHPDSQVRAAAEKVNEKTSEFSGRLITDPNLYRAFKTADLKSATPIERRYVKEALWIFRTLGADRSEESRKRLEKLQAELTTAANRFSANISKGQRKIRVLDSSKLAGLPDDFLAAHPPAAPDGSIVITTSLPDYTPVMTYAHDASLRRELYSEFRNRAWPENEEVLRAMTGVQQKLAKELGFSKAANSLLRGNMLETPEEVRNVIQMADRASRPRAANEYRQLVELKRRQFPEATSLDESEMAYWQQRLRQANYNFDANEARQYFPLSRVKQGVLEVTGMLFGVTYRRVENAAVWHPAVECWEVLENGKAIGRFYWDLHPRTDKYSHAASFPIRTGVPGKQLPEAVLVCNFPEAAPGLMRHEEVKTFFHEFGHILHDVFSGKQRYFFFSGTQSVARDFVEVPSLLMEEFVFDHGVLSTFARHHESGEAIPEDLVKRLRKAVGFGRGLASRQSLVNTDFNLRAYESDPPAGEYTAMFKESFERYMPLQAVAGTHMYASFGHMSSYPATYYTYLWDGIIVKDLFQKFDRRNLFDPKIARRYREMILEPGSARNGRELVEDFLGRPTNAKAWRRWMNEE